MGQYEETLKAKKDKESNIIRGDILGGKQFSLVREASYEKTPRMGPSYSVRLGDNVFSKRIFNCVVFVV